MGASPEEHQKRLEQIENMKARETQTEIIEDEKGVALPIPGTKAASELAAQFTLTNEEEMDELSFAGELEKHVEKEQENTIIIGIVAVAIIASVAGGVVFKLKKN